MSDTTIGIIIGSCFTTFGVILQGLVAWFLNWRSHKMTLTEQCEKETRGCAIEEKHKRESSYQDFLTLMGLYLSIIGAAKKESACPLPNEFQDGSVLRELSKAFSAIQLYGSPMIISLSRGYMVRFFSTVLLPTSTAEDIKDLDMELQSIADKMKSDLSQMGIGGSHNSK